MLYLRSRSWCARCFICWLFLLISLVVQPVYAQDSGAELSPLLALEITHPEGRILLDLLVESDGPVTIPIETEWVRGLLVATDLEGDHLRVDFSGIYDDASTLQLGTYWFDLPEHWSELRIAHLLGSGKALDWPEPSPQLETAPLPLLELDSAGLNGWSIRLSTSPLLTKGSCSCCRCGSLLCCPNSGRCLGCGNCGNCCCVNDEGGGTPPSPEQKG